VSGVMAGNGLFSRVSRNTFPLTGHVCTVLCHLRQSTRDERVGSPRRSQGGKGKMPWGTKPSRGVASSS
jgi:hypothetical protein